MTSGFGLVEGLGILGSIGAIALIKANIYKIIPMKKVKVSRETSKQSLSNEELSIEDMENEMILDDIENLIQKFELKIKTVDITKTINTINFLFEQYTENSSIVDKNGEIKTKQNFSKIKEIRALKEEFEVVTSPKLEIKSKNKLIVFEMPRKQEYRPKINYNDLLKKLDVTTDYLRENYKLPFILGIDENEKMQIVDLAEMPHLLIAGTTGSGKSVSLNTLICGLIKSLEKYEIKFAMADPKRVELDVYNDLGEYLFQPVAKGAEASEELIIKVYEEMQRRYKVMEENKARKIETLYEKGIEMPYLVLVIDEYANVTELKNGKDKKEFEKIVASIFQMGRACGIHGILATQRPSVDVVTGTIKSVLPNRISFYLPSSKDSMTILDCGGAEKLNGKGDGIFMYNDKTMRFQSCYMSDTEIENVVNGVK